MAAAALAGRPLTIPAPLSRVISVLVGISLGAVATPETLKGLAAFPISIAVLLVATVVMTAATTSYLRLVHGWPWQSALFGASPGALAQVMMLAAEYRADLRAIAIVQVMRVVILTIGIPAGFAYFGLTATGAFLPKSSAGISSISELAILVGLSTARGGGVAGGQFSGRPDVRRDARIGGAARHRLLSRRCCRGGRRRPR